MELSVTDPVPALNAPAGYPANPCELRIGGSKSLRRIERRHLLDSIRGISSVTNPERAKRAAARARQLQEQESLDGWRCICLGDGIDDNGNYVYFHEYEHSDGRQATWFSDGACSDPDLSAALAFREELRDQLRCRHRILQHGKSFLSKIVRSITRSIGAGGLEPPKGQWKR